MYRLIIFTPLFCLLFIQNATAGYFYSETGITQGLYKIDEIRFTPKFVRGKLGYNFTHFMAGELIVGLGAKEDDSKNVTVDPPGFAGLYFRYGGSIRQLQRAYLLFGVASTKIEKNISGVMYTDEYNDVSFGFGLEEHITDYRNVSITFEYTQYYNKDEVALRGINLGIRADF